MREHDNLNPPAALTEPGLGQRSAVTPDWRAPYPQAVNFTPTSASAREAHASGQLAQSSQAFPRGEGGNLGVANPLHERDDDVYVLAEVHLDDVYLISGADEHFEGPASLGAADALGRDVVCRPPFNGRGQPVFLDA